MDFLDPKKQRRHAILLYSGYFLIAIAIVISTVVLVYQANGFGVNGKGQVVQNGLVFFSSQPNPAKIYLNGTLNSSQTNSRISLPAGQYSARLSRAGYRNWQRNITVQGGDVQHYDYPFLFPSKLVTAKQADYKSPTGIATQSRDRRWLLVQQTPSALVFDMYDLKNPKNPSLPLTLPTSVARGTATGVQTWEALQWSDDNQHVLLKHQYGASTDFILVDRTDTTKSVNLNTTLGVNPAAITLIDNRYDQYHVLSQVNGDLLQASLGNPQPVKLLSNVLNYKSYGSKTLLYVSGDNAPEGKAIVSLFDGNKSSAIRTVALSPSYLLDMAGFRGSPYVAISASAENELYIYKDPVAQLGDASVKTPVALRALKLSNPSYLAFSPNTQYITVESGNQFGVYDIYLKHAYIYALKQPFDAPQVHASWMDGNRLTYTSASKTFVFDYDRHNQQTLMAASSSYLPYFAPDYKYVYALTPVAADGASQLTQTALLAPNDL